MLSNIRKGASVTQVVMRVINARGAWLLGLVALAIGLVKYGIDVSPGWQVQFSAVTAWPEPWTGSLLSPPQDYILSSPAAIILAGTLSISDVAVFFAFSLALVLMALWLPFLMPGIRQSRASARLLFIVLVGGPIFPVLLSWVGGYDALTVIGMVIGVLSRHPAASFLGWSLAAFNHLEITALAVLVWIGFITIRGRGANHPLDWKIPLAGLLGLVTGGAAITWLTSKWDVTPRSDIFERYGFDYFWNAFLASLPLVIFTALGILWIVLLDKRIRRKATSVFILAIALAASVLIPLIALDQTRTVALVLFPITLTWAASCEQLFGRKISDLMWKRYAIAAAIVPIVIIHEGSITYAGWQSLLSLRASLGL